MRGRRKKNSFSVSVSVLFLFLFFFSVLFISFPLKEKFPGNCDSMIVIAYCELQVERIKSFFTEEPLGTSMYPVEDPVAYGESSPGTQFFYTGLRLTGMSVYWTYFFYLTLMCALNGFGLFLLSGKFLSGKIPRIFSGLLFSCSNMVFAHIDDVIIFFYFPVFLSLFFLFRWADTRKFRDVFISALILGLEVYFSFYVFFYASVLCALSIMFLWKSKKIPFSEAFRSFMTVALISAVISMPHVFYHLYTLNSLQFVSPFEAMYTTKMTSLSPLDMLLALPGNRLYGWIMNTPAMNWGFVRHYNFIAPLTFFSALWALYRFKKWRGLFVIWIVAGLLLSIGPYFMFGTKELMPSPLIIFYKWIPILRFLRVTARAYFIVLLSFSILAAMTFEYLTVKFKKYASFFIVAVFTLHFFGNVPIPIHSFDIPLFYPEKTYDFIRKKKKDAIIADIPTFLKVEYSNFSPGDYKKAADFVHKNSDLPKPEIKNLGMFVDSWDNLFEYNRELIYAYYQTMHRMNTVNGVNGYFPMPRMLFQYHLEKLPEEDSVKWLKNNKVDYLVYHKNMVIKRDMISQEELFQSPCLQLVQENKSNIIFKPQIPCEKEISH